jgi:hypothetical protein
VTDRFEEHLDKFVIEKAVVTGLGFGYVELPGPEIRVAVIDKKNQLVVNTVLPKVSVQRFAWNRLKIGSDPETWQELLDPYSVGTKDGFWDYMRRRYSLKIKGNLDLKFTERSAFAWERDKLPPPLESYQRESMM